MTPTDSSNEPAPDSLGDLMIDDHQVVSMHYRLTNALGDVIDDSQGELPLVYMHNTAALLPSLERELTGHRAGESLHVVIYPEDAYGYVDESLVQSMPRSAFAHIEHLQEGMRIRAMGKDEESRMITVRELSEESVVVDGNHPLAGQVLNFDIAIVAVRLPTAAELEQGYATTTNAPG